MATGFNNFSKPFEIDGTRLKTNVLWLVVRLPSIALTLPAAWGVASFAADKLPILVAAFAGFAFESAMIGAIAIADQQYTLRKRNPNLSWYQQINSSAVLWWMLMLVAVLSSVLSNTLFFAGGSYANITPEILTHAVPLPVVNFMYNLVLHNAVTQKRQSFKCATCERVFESQDALNGHKGHCKG